MAAPFGPARAGFTFASGDPAHTIGATDGTLTFGQGLTFSGATGGASSGLTGVTTGNSSGSLTFSLTAGTTIAQPLTAVFTLNDPNGGIFTFDGQSVKTTAYSVTTNGDGTSDEQINLYILGTTRGGHNALDATASSVILNFTYTDSGFGALTLSQSSTLANPPDPDPLAPPAPPVGVPEPATMALIGTALVGLGFSRRRRQA